MHKIFSVDLYLQHPPTSEAEALDERTLQLLDWQPVDEAGMIVWRDGEQVRVTRVRGAWCEEIGPVAVQVIAEVVRQREAAVRMAASLSKKVGALQAQLHLMQQQEPDGGRPPGGENGR